ncbi:YMGG-like glycine zipper-containing protein [Pandoraea bronchicola]|uniref:Proline-rich region n=1 Tax=Pandoraea bronchicola TaxID=2508287 RepID=A0A5E5BRG4_9BURK|nr:YMGG-like glycine zipper-containing protein [Pandoraea bronchicola]VVE86890.1 proline-rich region [Pandoraea bronchicola]
MSSESPVVSQARKPSRATAGASRAPRRLAVPVAIVIAAATLAGCAVVPSGPSLMALPGSNKSFDQFRQDDFNCRQYASGQNGGLDTATAANTSALGSAVIGTAIGAAAGAAIGGGSGAAIGAGAGLLTGSAVGMGNAQSSAYMTQSRYDQAYVQCMYAYGNRVPVRGDMVMPQPAPQQRYAPPPPPPPGWKPPPGTY